MTVQDVIKLDKYSNIDAKLVERKALPARPSASKPVLRAHEVPSDTPQAIYMLEYAIKCFAEVVESRLDKIVSLLESKKKDEGA